ncbi:hypothetical protein [Dyella sp. C11]|uniref:hypothetical protein n=1 Tax=Dyella sp. C11 TaxID=2126991 RepID=UPI0013004C7B|nr:hypothetical protein [Dyella sp. C11]
MLAVVAFVWLADIDFPRLSSDIKKRLAQSGILLAYGGAMIGMSGLFWDGAFANARASSQIRLASALSSVEQFQRIKARALNANLDRMESVVRSRREQAEQDIEVAHSESKFKQVAGWIGLALVACGTVCQIVGAT